MWESTADALVTPPSCTRSGRNHVVTVKGIPGPGQQDYWKVMGTDEFCTALCESLSQRLDQVCGGGGDRGVGGGKATGTGAGTGTLGLTAKEIRGLIQYADEHASGLRWLWFW